MKRSDYMAIKPAFLEKYSRRYSGVIEAGIAQDIIESNKKDIDDQYPLVYRKEESTGIITLTGPMSNDGPDWIDLYLGYSGTAYKNLIRASKEILSDESIKNVTLYANTPGGNIDGLEEATEWLEKVVNSGREVTVINTGDIASAGVWYTSVATRVLGKNSTAMIGSIGVVIDTADYSGYYESMGIKPISITNSESPNKRPDLSEKSGQDIYKKELNALYGVFLDRVTGGRTVGADDVKALKGEMIIASEAIKIGLMDGIEGDSSSVSTQQPKQTEKTTKKENLVMDEDVKKCFDAINARFDKMEAVEPETKKELSAEDKKFALNIVTGGVYSATVIGEAGKVLAGDANIATLKAMTAAVDAVKEKDAGTAAADSTNAAGDTQPQGDVVPDAVKPDNGILDDNPDALTAELKEIKGDM